MAIDTKEKRASVIGVGRPYLRDKFPVASPTRRWRASTGLAYGSILATAITTIVGIASEINAAIHLRARWTEVDTDDA